MDHDDPFVDCSACQLIFQARWPGNCRARPRTAPDGRICAV